MYPWYLVSSPANSGVILEYSTRALALPEQRKRARTRARASAGAKAGARESGATVLCRESVRAAANAGTSRRETSSWALSWPSRLPRDPPCRGAALSAHRKQRWEAQGAARTMGAMQGEAGSGSLLGRPSVSWRHTRRGCSSERNQAQGGGPCPPFLVPHWHTLSAESIGNPRRGTGGCRPRAHSGSRRGPAVMARVLSPTVHLFACLAIVVSTGTACNGCRSQPRACFLGAGTSLGCHWRMHHLCCSLSFPAARGSMYDHPRPPRVPCFPPRVSVSLPSCPPALCQTHPVEAQLALILRASAWLLPVAPALPLP